MNAAFIERYQLIYQKDPNSRVFAPLAEAYRKMGMLDEALKICTDGVQKHPNFPSGRVAMAKILIEKKDLDGAIQQLKVACELSPENILAHNLLADTLLQTKRPREALTAYKMVLFLNPNDEKAQKTIKKLESLTAADFEDEVFQMKKLPDAQRDIGRDVDLNTSSIVRQRNLERFLSLADAYTVRNDIDRAFDTLESAENVLGAHPEIEKRKQLIQKRLSAHPPTALPEEIDLPPVPKSPRVVLLENLLQRIKERTSIAGSET